MTIDFKIEDADALGFEPTRLAAIPDFFETYLARKKCLGTAYWLHAMARLLTSHNAGAVPLRVATKWAWTQFSVFIP